MGLGTEECPVFKGMYEYAALACGATAEGARLILEGERHIAFNPSGGYHHAGPAYASGFCYINDVVIGCLLLADRLDRVLFVDIDVHHGDGVQNAFYDRRDVCTLSIHESGRTLFPGTGDTGEIGIGDGRGYSINVPLPPQTYDDAYLRAFDAVVPPILSAYDPDVVVLEIGMDALAGDPLAHLSLTNNAYAEAVKTVVAAGKPVLATGGGGYHPQNTARGWALVWTILCGEDPSSDPAEGLGGVFLESTEWQGGLRDRAVPPDAQHRSRVDDAIEATIRSVREQVFPLHGL
jgi:acetoin utilization protein AcuC